MRLFTLLVAFIALGAKAQPVITEDAKLIGSGTSASANAGWSIAADESLVVLGAFADESTPTTGAAYIFRETAEGWEEEAKLSASEESFFTFGATVGAWSDSMGDVIIVGASGNGFMPETDKAYIFRRRRGGSWVEEVRLTNGSDIHEAFGSAVAIYDDYAVVGAFGANDVGEASGAAYIFRRTSEGTWIEEARILASDASTPAGFGREVAVFVSSDGIPFVLAGAPSDSDRRGAAYTFRRSTDGTWVEEAKLVAPDSDTNDLFGRSVAITETPEGQILALAGALGDRDTGTQSGAGYVYRRESDDTWVFEKKLAAADGQTGQRLGWSVALAPAPAVGGTVAVLGGNGAYNFAGTVRIFRRTAGAGGLVWTEEAELWAGDRAPGEQIGYSVGASGSYAVAGAPYNGDGRGAGYVWDLRRAVPAEPPPVTVTYRGMFEVYPNPTRNAATVSLSLGRPAEVRVAVYDVLGRTVRVLHDGRLEAGAPPLALDASALPAGVYVVRATVGASDGSTSGPRGASRTFTRRLTVLQ